MMTLPNAVQPIPEGYHSVTPYAQESPDREMKSRSEAAQRADVSR